MRAQHLFPILAMSFGLGGCGSTDIAQFADGQPAMGPEKWMVGTVDGYGLVSDRFGTVKSQFHAHEVGSWDAAGKTVTVVEHIVYLQGSPDAPQDRTWTFVETAPGRWTGTAADVIGTAIGEERGNAWHLQFRQELNGVEVSIDDWRWRESDTVATAEIAFVKSN